MATPDVSVSFEMVFEGLSEAYSGDFVSLRNRSWEVVVRFGISLDR